MRLLSDNQQAAVEKLRRLKVGALFMGCGTGKTQTAVSLVNSVEGVNLVVWVAPLRTIENVKAEIQLCDCRYSIKFYGVESIGQSDRIYLEVLDLVQSSGPTFIVVDESLKIKNMNAKRTKRLITIGNYASYKLILNGTPVTKNILDIYAQMQFLSPKILQKDFFKFRDDYCCYKQKHKNGRVVDTIITGYANVNHLLKIIEPFVYECSLNLPLVNHYHTKRWRLTEDERLAYDSLKLELLSELEDSSDVKILGMLQKLQHSYCLSVDKVNALRGLIDDKTLVFCKFKRSVERVLSLYPAANVLTYGKNSYGLNLQNYKKIIYFDKTFDFAFREQSEARIYRLGQQNDCEYVDLTGDIGLEKMIDKCIKKKLDLISAFKIGQFKLENL